MDLAFSVSLVREEGHLLHGVLRRSNVHAVRHLFTLSRKILTRLSRTYRILVFSPLNLDLDL